MSKLAVLKFGGTSVADEKARLCALERIEEFLAKDYRLVVVVSAMGRKGAPYATDTLLSLVGENVAGEIKDLLMSCGENISACVFADFLCRTGIPAVAMSAVTAGIKTDGIFGSANITAIEPKNINVELDAGKVVVITGFQGISKDNRVNTLGRGGSDTSAVYLAASLKADECIIYTDVPGVASCDPRVLPDAKFFQEINASQMYELARAGAGVIHERAVKAAIDGEVNLYVRSTFENGLGTRISNEVAPMNGYIGVGIKKGKNQNGTEITIVQSEGSKKFALEPGAGDEEITRKVKELVTPII